MLTAVEEKLTVVNFFCLLMFGDVCTRLMRLIVGRTTHFFGFFTGKQNVSESMQFGENSHSAKFQADISNIF